MIVIFRNKYKLILSGLSYGLFITYIGLLFTLTAISFGQSTLLTCTREAVPPCQIRRTLYGIPVRIIPLDGLVGAHLEETRGSEGEYL